MASKQCIHPPLLSIGLIHGLASNDELIIILLMVLGIGSIEYLIGAIAFFTLGVMSGMVAFGLLATYPIIKRRAENLRYLFNLLVGFLSILYGLFMLNLGQIF